MYKRANVLAAALFSFAYRLSMQKFAFDIKEKIAPSAQYQDNHSDSLLLVDCRLIFVDNHRSQHQFG